MRMVDGVEIVVEEREGERPAILDDHAARAVAFVRAVFEEGADAQDRQGEPAGEEVGGGGDRASATSRERGPARSRVQQVRRGRRCGRRAGIRAASLCQSQAVPRTGPISMRPMSVLFAASTRRTGARQPGPDGGVEIVRFRVVVGGRSAADRGDA